MTIDDLRLTIGDQIRQLLFFNRNFIGALRLASRSHNRQS